MQDSLYYDRQFLYPPCKLRERLAETACTCVSTAKVKGQVFSCQVKPNQFSEESVTFNKGILQTVINALLLLE